MGEVKGKPEIRTTRPIEDHGLIGDRATAALVARDGTIDFMCWPEFDGPSVFAALLDPKKGGSFELRPRLQGARNLQLYVADTNVLLTRWLCAAGSVELVDLMRATDGGEDGSTQLIRRIRVTRGQVEIELRCRPRFDYGRHDAVVKPMLEGVLFMSPDESMKLRLASDVTLERHGHEARATFTLEEGQSAWFVLDDGEDPAPDSEQVEAWIEETSRYWQAWARHSTYRGRWREQVTRSALALKLMTSRKHGSIIAAPTFGLPEAPGAERNWDYRATWVRDASFTVYAFMRLGYREEAEQFMRWMSERVEDPGEDSAGLQLLYGIDGRKQLDEQILDHLAGYAGSKPVRTGNGASQQIQLDIFGELMDSIYLSNKYGQAISYDGWTNVRRIIDYVCRHWRDKDAGIWEMRSEMKQFLHSRLMCWVALDRAIRLAQKRSLAAPFGEWLAVRNEIHDDIWTNFWHAEGGHFVQALGTDRVDGALLLMPLVRFVSATDPRWLATLDKIGRELADDGMVFRYDGADGSDGLEGCEGAFTACSFWYIECLARAGQLEKAHQTFDKVLKYANHLGLFAEELALDGSHLGNFPQALTHLALISAAYYLDRELSGAGPGTWRP